jgi:hypothetical protein
MTAISTKKHVPTPEMRQKVYDFVSFGITEPEISKHFNIDPKTLRKHYRDELDKAMMESNGKVARVLYEKAVIDRDTGACIFWLKTRAKWATADGQRVAESTQTWLEKLPSILAKKNAE